RRPDWKGGLGRPSLYGASSLTRWSTQQVCHSCTFGGGLDLEERIDSREAWRVTIASTIIASVALGAPYIAIVALKPVAADFGGYRSIPSAAVSLAMLGTGVGGLLMSWLAERLGVRA